MASRAASHRIPRLVRGWSLATISTFSGVVSHVLAMGHVPPASLVAVCWALSGLVCVLLCGVRRSAFSTILSVVSSQGILHWLFAQTGHGVVMAPAGGGEMSAHSHHMMHGTGSLTATVSGHATGMSPAMVMTHLAAAWLTYLAIRRGDAALAALSQAIRLGLERVVSSIPRPKPIGSVSRPLPVTRTVRVLVRKAYAGPVPLRGPPSLLASV